MRLKNVSVIYTYEWYLPDSDRWQVIGIDTSPLGEVAYKWVKSNQQKWPARKDEFRLREFYVSNDSLAIFLERHSYTHD